MAVGSQSYAMLYCTGILRCLACGDNWVAVGNNSGTVNTLDLRMGELLHHWRPSDYSVVQVPCVCVCVWRERERERERGRGRGRGRGRERESLATLDYHIIFSAHVSMWFCSQTTTWNENLFQLRATRHGNLVTSVGPGTLHLWRPSTGKLLSHIRGGCGLTWTSSALLRVPHLQ